MLDRSRASVKKFRLKSPGIHTVLVRVHQETWTWGLGRGAANVLCGAEFCPPPVTFRLRKIRVEQLVVTVAILFYCNELCTT